MCFPLNNSNYKTSPGACDQCCEANLQHGHPRDLHNTSTQRKFVWCVYALVTVKKGWLPNLLRTCWYALSKLSFSLIVAFSLTLLCSLMAPSSYHKDLTNECYVCVYI